ncbi:CDA2 [Candida pseudojiufengensis]|uniref:CDA2 n=1 Tax=Candida pseudojiufengensis TaxID=497109 RepID=UPI002223EF74|nr:CDA2 [Candida pseudojiufengensis]KAI5963470.1 CDA2 [Candida pseudojiufengensis]
MKKFKIILSILIFSISNVVLSLSPESYSLSKRFGISSFKPKLFNFNPNDHQSTSSSPLNNNFNAINNDEAITKNNNNNNDNSEHIINQLSEMPPSPMRFPPKLPFPKWLTDFTGLKEWPDLNPPYIPLDFINFNKIEDLPIHKQSQCSNPILRSPIACSFDCFNCVEFDDIYTCPKISQTFDDGPSPHTKKLLNALKQKNTKTTLFTLGVNIIRFPEIYKESLAEGHIMGSHTWSHKFLPSLTNQEIIAQIEWSIWAMNATGNHLPKWFRPPYGGIDNRIRSILRQFGMQAVLWDFDTFDWKMLDNSNLRNEKDIYKDVLDFKNLKQSKGIILEHDAILRTVDVGIEILNNILGDHEQLTIPKCVGGIDYIKTFDNP